jgi:hypothetical protein
MCTAADGAPAPAPVPSTVAEALRMAEAALGYLRDQGAAALLPAELGGALEAMGTLGGKLATARAALPGSTPSGPIPLTGTGRRRRG